MPSISGIGFIALDPLPHGLCDLPRSKLSRMTFITSYTAEEGSARTDPRARLPTCLRNDVATQAHACVSGSPAFLVEVRDQRSLDHLLMAGVSLERVPAQPLIPCL